MNSSRLITTCNSSTQRTEVNGVVVSAAPLSVVRAIDLDDELAASADEITDVACERHLATKRHAQLAIDERAPEELLRRRRLRAHGDCARGEKSFTLWKDDTCTQSSLLSPAKRPGSATLAQALCQAPTIKRAQRQAWRRACALGVARPRPGLRRPACDVI
jgi:hypothetical protein